MIKENLKICDNCDNIIENNSNKIQKYNKFIDNDPNYEQTKELQSTKYNKNRNKFYVKQKFHRRNKKNFMIETEKVIYASTNCNHNEKNIQDLVKAEEFDKKLCESSKTNRMHLAINLLVSLANALQNLIRLRGFQSEKFWKAAYAYAANTISMGLSSVQVSNRIEPILKIIKFKKLKSNDETHTTIIINTPKIKVPELLETAEECVTINVLVEPPPNVAIRADIIFIHGLHGSLVNTWKQGMWSNERNPVDFERPPRPPLRPPKRPRHSRSNIFIPPHSNKKFKLETPSQPLEDEDNLDFIFDNKEEEDLNSPEYFETTTFSTFRLRFDSFDNSLRSTSPTPPTSPCPDFHNSSNHNNFSNSNNNNNINFESSTNCTSSYSKCWPGDWLPLDCPGVRVIAVNYTTDPYLWRPIWKKKYHRSTMAERVRVMTEMLIEKKVGCGHPIVWVGHSKGGLFIKQIIVEAWESGKLSALPLLRSSRGVFFYSVPHRGSVLADINLPFIRRSIELIEIEKNSKVLSDLHRRFVGLYYSGHLKVEVFSFVETAMTFMQVLYLRIVGVDSADPGIGDVCGLQLDHREICKPRSRNCILYTELMKMIQKIS